MCVLYMCAVSVAVVCVRERDNLCIIHKLYTIVTFVTNLSLLFRCVTVAVFSFGLSEVYLHS